MSHSPSFESNKAQPESALSEHIPFDVAPPLGVTPPQTLAREAAAGKRGAAWRLLQLVMENDPRAIKAVSSLNDPRLTQSLVEFIAVGTWAGKPFVTPAPLRTPYTRTRLRTLFVPPSGIDPAISEQVVLGMARDERPAVREAALYILGLMGAKGAVPTLIQALHDPEESVRLQAAKALGRTGSPDAVQALLTVLPEADERMGSQIFMALVSLGHLAVPVLLECARSDSGWMRWHSVRALGRIHDPRALPVLVNALQDADHSVAWMAAKGLAPFERVCIEPVLHLLTTAQMTPWVAETASYVLHRQCQAHEEFKPYLEPLLQQMHQPAYRVGTGYAALKTLEHLRTDGLLP